MSWLPVLVLTVLGILSIAFMMQMPKEKPVHNVKRVMRGKPEPVVEPVVEPKVEHVVEPVELKSKSMMKPVVEPVVQKAIRWHQVSSQYNRNMWKKAKCDNCMYENDIKKADVVFAHPHKTKIKRYHPSQLWVSQFWESEGIYPDINTEKFNAFKSYRRDATFPCYAMMTDTFKPEKMIEPLPYEKKIDIEWMSVWLSNCGASGRNSLLKRLQKEGITTASYGKCNRDHSESKLHFSSNEVDIWDRKKSSGNQKIAHSSNHLFLFAAENNISPFYHTEKLYHGFMAGSVPVYYGSDTIDEYVPEHSIIKVSDYGTGLSDYLKKVANDKELYKSYLAWRNKPLPEYLTSKLNYKCKNACEICQDLHDMKWGIRERVEPVEPEPVVESLNLAKNNTAEKKTVGIVTVMTKQNKWCECGTKTMQAYADTHGYSYYLITKENHFLKHVKFQKYAAVLDNMKHDIMVLMDCDIAITNPQIKVEEIFEEYNNDIIIARDAIWKKGVPINSGVIIFKNSQFSKGVLEKMKYSSKSTSNKYLGKALVDQPVLTHLLVEKGIKEHPSTAFEKTNHVTIVPQRVMNAFHRRGISFFKNDPEDSRWRKGDWLAHVTGSPAPIRNEIMEELGACRDNSLRVNDDYT